MAASSSHRKEAANAQVLEQVELRRGAAAPGVEELSHLVAQLEGGGLEAEVGPRADLQDEPEVDVHQAALRVDQDVAVVAVLGLQEETGNGVPAGRCEQPSEGQLSWLQWTACGRRTAGGGWQRCTPAKGIFPDMQEGVTCVNPI